MRNWRYRAVYRQTLLDEVVEVVQVASLAVIKRLKKFARHPRHLCSLDVWNCPFGRDSEGIVPGNGRVCSRETDNALINSRNRLFNGVLAKIRALSIVILICKPYNFFE
jgi:hypothetical protein